MPSGVQGALAARRVRGADENHNKINGLSSLRQRRAGSARWLRAASHTGM